MDITNIWLDDDDEISPEEASHAEECANRELTPEEWRESAEVMLRIAERIGSRLAPAFRRRLEEAEEQL